MIYIGCDNNSTYYLDGNRYYVENNEKLIQIPKECIPELKQEVKKKGSLFN